MSTITDVTARSVWDSRGRPTVEVEVAVSSGVSGRAIAPAGASRGLHEAVDLRDGGTRYGGNGVQSAITGVREILRPLLLGLDVTAQSDADALIAEAAGDSKRLVGGNATTATSMAIAHTAAAACGVPLWRYLAAGSTPTIPVPEIQIFGGGAHAGRRTDIQDFMVVVPHAASIAEALETTAEVYHAAGRLMAERGTLVGTADEGGWWPEFSSNEDALRTLVTAIERAGHTPGGDVFISIDVAASEFFDGSRYVLGLDRRELAAPEFVDLICGWVEQYPIISVEDPVSQDDISAMAEVTARIGQRVQLIGDDLLVTDPQRIARFAEHGACNSALIKINQVGTVTEGHNALLAAQRVGWGAVVSARSGESEDVTIAHLAVGWNAGQIKVGSMVRSERTAKWNELLRIEEASGLRFAGVDAIPSLATASG